MREYFTCKKAENCFANAKSFHYLLEHPIDESMLERFSEWGNLTVKRNFRRPFFMMETADGVKTKGILNDVILKAGFAEDGWEEQKQKFEQQLSGILEKLP